MIKINPIITLSALFFTFIMIIPALIVLPFQERKEYGKVITPKPETIVNPSEDSTVEVSVFRSSKAKIEKIPLEQYLVGVVASEMPADFEEEALKAQAVTARTFIVKELISNDHTGLPQGAEVGDTVKYQVYNNLAELKTMWGKDYNWKIGKITEAVKGTSGQIITYNGQPIEASFFSTSNGYTENSEDYWSSSLPYLRSVPSPWDKNSPKFSSQQIFTVSNFEDRLGIHLSPGSSIGTILSRTVGNRVGKVVIDGMTFTGKQIREKLNLRSSDFTWIRKGDSIIIDTKGYGHGVGMSQYGANGMAAQGKSYQDIIKYYYSGVQISLDQKVLSPLEGKN